MGQAERPTCPHCGAFLILALPPGGEGQRRFQCFECDGLDPLKTDKVLGWLATATEVAASLTAIGRRNRSRAEPAAAGESRPALRRRWASPIGQPGSHRS